MEGQMNPDQDYYERREQQERESAERSADHGARQIHLELAKRYSAMKHEMPMPAQL
jgi:hypothetical protein